MPTSNQKDLTVKITGKVELTEFQKLKKEFKDNQTALGELSIAGKQTSAEFQKLTAIQKTLSEQIKATTRESKGLSAQTKMSSAQWLEYGENLTVVGAGLTAVLKGLYSASSEMIKQGATLKVLRENYKGTAEDLKLLTKASAGTLTEAQLIPIFNKATGQMKLTTEETARLLAYSEDLADKGIGTLTENFNSLTTAILTGGRGLRTLGIDQKQFKEDLKKTAEQIGISTGLIQDGNEEDSISIEKLDAKTQRILILKTLFDGGYIPSLENVINKTEDSADKIEAMNVKLQEAKTEAGLFILKGAEPLIDSFLGMSKAGTIAAGSIAGVGSTVASVLPLIAGLKIAFGGAALAAMGLYGAAAAAGLALGALLAKLENQYDLVGRIQRMYGLAPDKLTINDYIQNFPKGNIQDQIPYGPNLPTQEELDRQKIGDLTKGIKNGSKGSKGSGTTKTVTEITNDVIDLTKSIADLNAKLAITSPESTLFFMYSQQITELQNKIDYLNSSFKDSTGLEFGTLPTYDNSQAIPQQELSFAQQVEIYGKEKADPMEEWNKIKNISSGVLSDIGNIMNVLNIGADTFAGQMLNTINAIASGFNSVLNLVNTFGGGGVGGIIGTVIGGIGSIFGLGRSSGGGGRSPDFSRFNGGLAGGGNNMRIEFGDIKGVVRGEDIYISATAFKTGLNQRRF